MPPQYGPPRLHAVCWNVGERVGAMLASTWDMLDIERGMLELPAEIRKGNSADMLHVLHADTVAILLRLKPAGYDRIFPWPFSEGTFYNRYKRLLKRAGLPHGRRDMMHKMRKSFASHLQARGVDSCAALGHVSPDVTRKSYLDPRIVIGANAPCAVLPQPIDQPLRIGYVAREAEPVAPELAWL